MTSPDAAAQLLTAAEHGDNGRLVELLDQNVPVDVYNPSHFTPLILAAYAGNIEGLKILVSRGANINAASLSGNNAIMMASQNGKTEIVEYLITISKATVSTIRNKTGDTPLMFASKNGHLQTVKLLLKLGAKEDAVNSSGMTAIFCAASEGHADVLQELLSAGNGSCTPKQLLQTQDINGNTPLHFASYGGHIKVVEQLLERGASPFIRNRSEKTPLTDITDSLPKFTDEKLIQNVTTCKTMLVKKCKELEELSQKNMNDLTKFDQPEKEVSKKQSTKQKIKNKKRSSGTQPVQEGDSNSGAKQMGSDSKEDGLKGSGTKDSGMPQDTVPKDVNNTGSGPTKSKESEPKSTNNSENSQPINIKQPTEAKSLPLDIPPTTQPLPIGKSPTVGKSPIELYSTIVKSTSPATGTSLLNIRPTPPDGKAQARPTGPPGFPSKSQTSTPPTSSNTQNATPKPQPSLSQPPPAKRLASPAKTTVTTNSALLDQALSCINSLAPNQSSGHSLEIAYRDYTDMCTAMTSLHPNAVALDLPVKATLGLGLSELSMEQLGVLEEMHHKMLQAITDAKLNVVRSQERMRLEEQKELEIALLTNKLRSVE